MVGRAFAKQGVTTAVMSYRVSSVEWHTLMTMNIILTLIIGPLGFIADAVPGSPPGWICALAAGGSVMAALLLFQVWQRSQQEVFAKWPMHRDDVASALSFLAGAGNPGGEFFGKYDPHNLFVIGHSAGGHMVLMTCFDSALLKSIGIRVASASQALVDDRWPPAAPGAYRVDESTPLAATPAALPTLGAMSMLPSTSSGPVTVKGAQGTLRGVIAVSPPCIFAHMTATLFARHVFMRSVFGTDQSKWQASFPDHLIAVEAAARTCPKPPLLLITASPGWDLGLEVHADELEVVLRRADVAYRRVTVTVSNHFSEMLHIDRPGSQSSRILGTAVVGWLAAFAEATEPLA